MKSPGHSDRDFLHCPSQQIICVIAYSDHQNQLCHRIYSDHQDCLCQSIAAHQIVRATIFGVLFLFVVLRISTPRRPITGVVTARLQAHDYSV